ncbi:Protein transport protein SEC31 B [Zea mays]|uniref:Protein transport protein SEC31 B n=1 Tax=Zea mays TaxID=4577 RepID=A0A317Y5S3_MAIZE|nr:Protein transport protein SEC31 B [Zea mays]
MLGLTGDPALARLEMGRSVSYDDGPVPVRPAPASPPISRSRSDGGAVPASATKPPLGGRSPGSSEATPEGEEEEEADPRCLIRNLDDGSEFVVKEGSELREVGTGRQLTMEEFVDLCVGRSPIVQELMRRENVASSGSSTPVQRSDSDSSNGATRHRRRRRHSSWLRGIRNIVGSVVASSRDRRSSDDKDTCSEKGGRRSSSATDDSQDSAGAVRHGPVRVKVRQYGKSYKEFSGLFMNQEIQAHDGSIWSIRFSPDGRYLASAGEDCVIHVWEVSEFDRKREENGACNPFVAMVCNGSPEPTLAVASSVDGSNREKKRRASGVVVASNEMPISVHVHNLVIEQSLVSRSTEFEAAIQNGDKITDNADAQFLIDNGDDFFNNPQPAEASLAEESVSTNGQQIEQEVSGDVVPSDPSIDKSIQHALVVGDYKGAVNQCLASNRMVDALVIAHAGGSALWENTRNHYLKNNISPYLKVVSAMVGNDLMSFVSTWPLSSWKETHAHLWTYPLASQHGRRLGVAPDHVVSGNTAGTVGAASPADNR